MGVEGCEDGSSTWGVKGRLSPLLGTRVFVDDKGDEGMKRMLSS